MTECNICFHNLDKISAWKCDQCGQICHQFCIDTWRGQRQVCPFCIKDISNSELVYTSESEETNITIQEETIPIVEEHEVVVTDDTRQIRKYLIYTCIPNTLCFIIVGIYTLLYVYNNS